MKKWKVIIEYQSKILELTIEAKYYSDAYVDVEKKYPGCIVKSISEIHSDEN